VPTTPKNVVESNSQAQSASSSQDQRTKPPDRYRQSRLAVPSKPESWVRSRQEQIASGQIKPAPSKSQPTVHPIYEEESEEARSFIQRTASTGYSGLNSSGQGTYFAGTPSMPPAETFIQQIGAKGLEQMGYTPVSTMQGERYVRLEKSPQQEQKISGNVVGPYEPVKFGRLKTYAGDFATGFRFGSKPDLYAYTANDMRLDPQKTDRILAYGAGSALSVASVTGFGREVLTTLGAKISSTSTVSSLLNTPVGKINFGLFGGFVLLGYGATQTESTVSALQNKDYLEASRVVVNTGFDIARISAFSQGFKQGLAKSEFRTGSSQTKTPSNYKYDMTTTETNIGGTSKSMTSGYIAEYAKSSASKPNRVVSFTDYGNVREIIGQDLKTGQISVTYQNLYSGKTVSTSYFAPKDKFYSPSQLEQGFIGQKLFVDKTQSQMLVPTSKSWSQPSAMELEAYRYPENLMLSTTLPGSKPIIRTSTEKYSQLSPNLAVAERGSSMTASFEQVASIPAPKWSPVAYTKTSSAEAKAVTRSITESFKQSDLVKDVASGTKYDLLSGIKLGQTQEFAKNVIKPKFELGGEVDKPIYKYKARELSVQKYDPYTLELEGFAPQSPKVLKVNRRVTTSIGEQKEISKMFSYYLESGYVSMVPNYKLPFEIKGKKAQAGFSFEPISITKPKTQLYEVSTVKVESPNYSYDLGKVWSQSNLGKTKSNLGVSSLALLGSATKLDSKLKLDTKTNLSSRSSSKRLPDKIQTLKVNTRIDTARAVSPKITSRTFTSQVSQTASLSTAIPSYLRNVSIRPPKPPTQASLPTWGLGGRSLKGRSVKGSGFGFGNVAKYTPSLVAYEYKIKGKRKDDKELFTGFEIRPL
jgi:hypothetical protein